MSIAYKKNGTWVTASGTPPIDNALSATSENAVQNKIVKQAVDNSQQMIAPILPSLVAPSGGLESEDQFIYQGLLYKATASIAQGGTITIGGNCVLADSVTGQIGNLIIRQRIELIPTIQPISYAGFNYAAGFTPPDLIDTGYRILSAFAYSDDNAKPYILCMNSTMTQGFLFAQDEQTYYVDIFCIKSS